MSSYVTSIYSQDNPDAAKPGDDARYGFENFVVDRPMLLLYRDGQPVVLAPKVIETLVALVERSGEVVSKAELMNRLWGDSFVEESNLTQNIYLLRKTLGKREDGRDLIETFRRRGYRFTGELRPVSATSAKAKPTSVSSSASIVAGEEPRRRFESVAVLPLLNQTNDSDAEYLSDGVTESIISRLSQISGLRVLARSTVFRFKGQELDATEVGRELGVDAVLTGRILEHWDTLIVRVELVDVRTGGQIWGEQYNRQLNDVLELQATIAREISDNLRVKLTGDEQKRLTQSYTKNAIAYQLFIRARYFLNKRLTPEIEKARTIFQQAIDLDPGFAPAYVGLADCYPLLSLYSVLTPHDAYPKAKAAAMRALELDDSYTKAYNSLGVTKLFYEWDWTGAEQAFRRAIELNPGYPDAHQRYGMFLTAMGRFDEAIDELQRARQLDPLSPITQVISAYPYYYSRQYESAARLLREVIADDEGYSMAHFRLGLALAQKGSYDQAVNEVSRSVELSNDRDTIAALAYVEALSGDRESAYAALTKLDDREKEGFVTSYNRVMVYAGLGENALALDWLERAYDERSYWLIYLRVDPVLDPLRNERRFIAIDEKMFPA